MYVSVSNNRRFIKHSRANLSGLSGSSISTDLDEVRVNVKRIEDPLQEIVVSAKRIPWYEWVMLGIAAATLFYTMRHRK